MAFLLIFSNTDLRPSACADKLSHLPEQVRQLQRNGTVEHEFSIFWVPRRTLVCNQILEDEGIIGDINIAEFPLFFLPLENDVLSLELENSLSDLYLV
jgi:hypothetical protein